MDALNVTLDELTTLCIDSTNLIQNENEVKKIEELYNKYQDEFQKHSKELKELGLYILK